MTSPFDRCASDYQRHVDRSVLISGEGSEYYAEYKSRYLAEMMPVGFRGKILDFGCGVGLLARCIRQTFPDAELHGYDESVEMVPHAAKHATAARSRFTADANALDHDYDLIIVANVLHHIDRDRRTEIVRQLAGRLRPAGRMAVFEHNWINPLTRWAVSRCPFDRGVRLLAPAEAKHHLQSAGLRAHRVEYIVFFPRAMRAFRPLEARLRWCALGAQYVAIGAREG